ncbi:Uncharacterised protein [Vibrio cholerae]|uniref:Uncharacterized protein n=1 Tax=Vibrio cholerae TaxID=666 RepID=A0A656ATU2_VIBCL|nr:Uncharacterised protein [Vibrio cholerae]CSB27890.1 Uncharacterised protein [Vibrio cholerae]CSB37925.1 Uncharacterised protein [Vibrio cholerae]CSC02384.1 Uncharacterised protein [Vibrio cholerae]CSC06086.1 Uncharacterised protein [Vibrio cholerae]
MAIDQHQRFYLVGVLNQLFIGKRFGVDDQCITAAVDEQFQRAALFFRSVVAVADQQMFSFAVGDSVDGFD